MEAFCSKAFQTTHSRLRRSLGLLDPFHLFPSTHSLCCCSVLGRGVCVLVSASHKTLLLTAPVKQLAFCSASSFFFFADHSFLPPTGTHVPTKHAHSSSIVSLRGVPRGAPPTSPRRFIQVRGRLLGKAIRATRARGNHVERTTEKDVERVCSVL